MGDCAAQTLTNSQSTQIHFTKLIFRQLFNALLLRSES